MNRPQSILCVLVVLALSALVSAQATVSTNLQLNLPEGWRAMQTAQGAVLEPPAMVAGAELYSVSVAAAPAGATLRDPAMAQAVLMQILQQFPGFHQATDPGVCNVGGEMGVKIAFVRSDPATQQRTLAAVWVTVGQGRMIVLTAGGEHDTVAARLETMDQIAANLRCGAVEAPPHGPGPGLRAGPAPRGGPMANPNIDPALVGAWQMSNCSSYNSRGGAGDLSMSTASVTTMYLHPDGQGVCNVRTQMAGGTADVSYDGTRDPGNNYPIAWAARHGVFDMRMQNGNGGPSRYQVSGDTLVTIGPRGERTVYRRVG